MAETELIAVGVGPRQELQLIESHKKEDDDSLESLFSDLNSQMPEKVVKIVKTLNDKIHAVRSDAQRDHLEHVIHDIFPYATYAVTTGTERAQDPQFTEDVGMIQTRLEERLIRVYDKVREESDPTQIRLEKNLAKIDDYLAALPDTYKNSMFAYITNIQTESSVTGIEESYQRGVALLTSLGRAIPSHVYQGLAELLHDAKARNTVLIAERNERFKVRRPPTELSRGEQIKRYEDAIRDTLAYLEFTVNRSVILGRSTEMLVLLGKMSRQWLNLGEGLDFTKQWWQNYLGRNENKDRTELEPLDSRIGTEAGSFPIASRPRDMEQYRQYSQEAKMAGYTHAMLKQRIKQIELTHPHEVATLRAEFSDRLNQERDEMARGEIIRNIHLEASNKLRKASRTGFLTVIDEELMRKDQYDLLPLVVMSDSAMRDAYLRDMVTDALHDQTKIAPIKMDDTSRAELHALAFSKDKKRSQKFKKFYRGVDRILNFHSARTPSVNEIFKSPFSNVGSAEMATTVVSETGLCMPKANHLVYDGGPVQQDCLGITAEALNQMHYYQIYANNDELFTMPLAEVRDRSYGMPQLESLHTVYIHNDSRKAVGKANEVIYRFTPTNIMGMAIKAAIGTEGTSASKFTDYQELVDPKFPFWKPDNPYHNALGSYVVGMPYMFVTDYGVLAREKEEGSLRYVQAQNQFNRWAEHITRMKFWNDYGLSAAAAVSGPLGKLSQPIGPIANLTDQRISFLRNPSSMYSPLPLVSPRGELKQILETVQPEFFSTARSDVTTRHDLHTVHPLGGIFGYTTDPNGVHGAVDIVTVKVEISDLYDTLRTSARHLSGVDTYAAEDRFHAPLKEFVDGWGELTVGKKKLGDFLKLRDETYNKFLRMGGFGRDTQIRSPEDFMEWCNKNILERGAHLRLNEQRLKLERDSIINKFELYGASIVEDLPAIPNQ